MSDIYKHAAINKFRFTSSKGMLTVEDLFDLPLTSTTGKANLDDIARILFKQIKESEEVSFVNTPAAKDADAAIALEIVKDIIAHKKAENEARAKSAEATATKQKIMALIDQKKDAAMSEKSIEELQAELAKL